MRFDGPTHTPSDLLGRSGGAASRDSRALGLDGASACGCGPAYAALGLADRLGSVEATAKPQSDVQQHQAIRAHRGPASRRHSRK